MIVFVLITFAVEPVFSQQTEDWSELFPEMDGCDRTVRPMTKNDSVIEQSAVYTANDKLKTNSALSARSSICGTVTLRSIPSIRKIKAESYKRYRPLPFYRKIRIKNYVAYKSTPKCGNDNSRGSIEVLFDEDKSLTIHAYKHHGTILGYAEKVNYKKINRSMSIFVKSNSFQF